MSLSEPENDQITDFANTYNENIGSISPPSAKHPSTFRSTSDNHLSLYHTSLLVRPSSKHDKSVANQQHRQEQGQQFRLSSAHSSSGRLICHRSVEMLRNTQFSPDFLTATTNKSSTPVGVPDNEDDETDSSLHRHNRGRLIGIRSCRSSPPLPPSPSPSAVPFSRSKLQTSHSFHSDKRLSLTGCSLDRYTFPSDASRKNVGLKMFASVNDGSLPSPMRPHLSNRLSVSSPLTALPALSSLNGRQNKFRFVSTTDRIDKRGRSLLDSFDRLEDDLYAYEEIYSFQEYETENTPICFSNDSPLSSLSFEMLNCESQSPSSDGFLFPDQLQTYFTEGTPICFSHDSPLSSLSLNLSFEKQSLGDLLSLQSDSDGLNIVEEQSADDPQKEKLSDQPKLLSGSLPSSRHSPLAHSEPHFNPLSSALSKPTESLSRHGFETFVTVSPPSNVNTSGRKSTFGNLTSCNDRIEITSSAFKSKVSNEKSKEQIFTEQLNKSLSRHLSTNPDFSSRVSTRTRGSDYSPKSVETFEEGFDESEDFDQFYLNQCISSGRSAIKDDQPQQEPPIETEKLKKIIAPLMSLDLCPKEKQPLVYKPLKKKEPSLAQPTKRHHHYHRSSTRDTHQFTHTVPVTKLKQSLSDTESVLTLGGFPEKFTSAQMSRFRYKIDGQEDVSHDVEEHGHLSSEVHPSKLFNTDDLRVPVVKARHSALNVPNKSRQQSSASAQCASLTSVLPPAEAVIKKKGFKNFLKLANIFKGNLS